MATTRLVNGSTREAVLPARRDQPPTQTASGPAATTSAASPTGTVATTRSVARSTRERVPSPWLATHRAPWPTAIALGCRPTGMVPSDGSGPAAGGS